jgi:hypothetical protein
MTLLVGGAASAAVQPPAFSATAAADGVRESVDIPGAPLDDRLIDTGGPTAQAAVTSFGTSTGYAALPDPGSLVNSAPGLVTGLVGQGAAGLPPIKLPTVPPIPVEVATSASGTTSAHTGAGPYSISAKSATTSSSADATGGLESGLTGDIAGLASHVSIATHSDGSVTAAASTEVNGLAVGPLSIGSITSTASETLSASGVITPSSSTKITALSVGGIAVTVGDGGLAAGGGNLPLPVGKLLAPLLSAANITTMITTTKTTKGRVVAPAVLLTVPVRSGIGTAAGTMSLTIGGATASMSGASGGAPVPTPVVSASTGPTPPVGTGSSGVSAGGSSLGTGSIGGGSDGVVSPGVGSSASGATGPTVSPPVVAAAHSTALLGLFDIRSLYLAIAALGLGVALLSQLIRLLGVRA